MAKKVKLDTTMIINGYSVSAILRMIEIVALDVEKTSASPNKDKPHFLTDRMAIRCAQMLTEFFETETPICDGRTTHEINGILLYITAFITRIATT